MIADDDKNTKYTSILLDQSEMAVRLVEALTGDRRPPQMSNEEALDMLDDNARYKIHEATRAMAEYFAERMKEAVPSTEFMRHEGRGGMN